MAERVKTLDSNFLQILERLNHLKLPAFEKRQLALVLISVLITLMGAISVAPVAAQECSRVLLAEPGWNLEAASDSVEAYQEIDPQSLVGMDTIQAVVNFNGYSYLTRDQSQDASVLIFDDNDGWYTAVLPQDDFNSFNQDKVVNIPLTAFEGLNTTLNIPFTPQDGVGTLHTRFWSATPFAVDISRIVAFNSQDSSCSGLIEEADYTIAGVEPGPESQIRPTPNPVIEPVAGEGSSQTFEIRSVSTMKITKDMIRNPLSVAEINSYVAQAAELGANMVAVETPYDNPTGGDSVAYTYQWIEPIRSREMNVHHRHMGLQFEGLYDEPKVLRLFGEELPAEAQVTARDITSVPFDRLDQYQVQIYRYILDHPDMFAAGDIFTPAPEPDSRGVVGLSDCSNDDCMFSSVADFNQWLIDSIAVAKEAFEHIGFEEDEIQVGVYGFSGFTVAGLSNPDWEGTTSLSCEAIDAMGGVVAIDHYTEAAKMADDLEIARTTLTALIDDPTCLATDFIIAVGEYGSSDPDEIRQVMEIFAELGIGHVNYWSLVGGDTGLIVDGEVTERYSVVRDFFQPQ